MKTAAHWRAGSASDTGLQRTINEDRVWLDEGRGIFLVVDGLGGHAAGETAASIAVEIVSKNLNSPEQIKAVICAANNEIYRRAEENEEWRGMACVLTLAVMQDDQVSIGHVGDSRLYMLWNGQLKKITNDHSPVGEQEDNGLLTEEQAMHHPRRNEVFRDVGSAPHLVDDEDFIETHAFPFRDDAALLLCSDGLTDCVTAGEITDILEQYEGDAERCAQQLVEAANAAGGKDNISAIFVAGDGFIGTASRRGQNARARHATTRPRGPAGGPPKWAKYSLLLLVGIGAGFGMWRLIVHATTVPATVKEQPAPAPASHTIEVSSANARGIIDALATAASGDTISVPPGEFLGPLIIKEGVNIVASNPGEATVRCDPAATAEQGTDIVARGVHKATIAGLKLAADDTHPLKTGVLLADSSIDLNDMDVSGAVYSGIRIEGDSQPYVHDNFIHGNAGAGIAIEDNSAPRIVHNQVLQNGLMVNATRPGIEIGPNAKPVLEQNLVSGNGAEEPLKAAQPEAKKREGKH